jgi:RND superfamily putative drug exporter
LSHLLSRIGSFAFTRRRLVVPGCVALIVAMLLLAVAGGGAFTSSNSIPGSPAQKTLDTMDRHFPNPDRDSANIVFQAPAGHRIAEPTYAKAIATTLKRAAGVTGVATVSGPGDVEVSPNGRTSVASVDFRATKDDGAAPATLSSLKATGVPSSDAGMHVTFGGHAYDTDASPIGPTEGIGMLVALAVLAITFGSLLAAGMPLLTALLGVALSMAAMMAASATVGIPDTALTLSVMIGLAVGIDYALFIISRHRTQLAAGMSVERSVARAVGSAGSAVVFAGLTVIIALAGLTVAQVPMLTGIGLSAAGTVAVAVVLALVLVPALLGFAGTRLTPKLDSRTARRLARAAGDRPTVFGARWARLVTARPRLSIAIASTLLVAMAIPALSLKTSLTDEGNSAKSSPARQAYDIIARDLGAGSNGPLVALVQGKNAGTLRAQATTVAKTLAAVPGVASASGVEVSKDGQAARVRLTPTTAPTAPATKALVKRLQSTATTAGAAVGASVAITGQTAVDIDVASKLSAATLPFGIVVVGLSLLLLLVAFRSIAIPIKAALGFLLSVGASFGATVAVFQWGWLAGPLGVPSEGPVASFMPIITMAVLFGLAMDYQVFVISSIKEAHTRTRDARASIILGAAHASRVVTAAALIMVAVFGSFVTNPDANIKPIGFSLAVGVLVDAFLVRMTLVPAVLSLLGERAWRLPRWLDRRLPHVDLEGSDHATPAPTVEPQEMLA